MTIEPSDLPQPSSCEPDPGEPGSCEILPAFAPVPRQYDRSNGWKPEVQRAFIEALAETGSVKSACRRVGRAEHGAYLLRRHPQAEEFRRAWDAALDIGMRRIEDVAMERALNGYEQPVYSYGKLVGTRTVYNDRLLMFMLRNRAPERFGAGLSRGGGAKGDNAIDKMILARLKAQWRQEWEDERAAKASSPEAIRRTLMQRLAEWRVADLEEIRRAMFEAHSPRVQALWEAYEAARDAEREATGAPRLPALRGASWRGITVGDDFDAGERLREHDAAEAERDEETATARYH